MTRNAPTYRARAQKSVIFPNFKSFCVAICLFMLIKNPSLLIAKQPSTSVEAVDITWSTREDIQIWSSLSCPTPAPDIPNLPRAPPPSPASSLTSIQSSFPSLDMARQRKPRANKRNLVRWTDEMDKKLLLSIQSECNAHGMNIPWNGVAALVGPTITGSAVIQHLAKLRARMVQQGLSVPPPLRRGGGQKISTGPSIPPSNRGTKEVTNARAGPAKPCHLSKKTPSEESGSDDFDTDSDGEYGKACAKRVKAESKTKQGTTTPSSNDSGEEEVRTPTTPGIKREVSASSGGRGYDRVDCANDEEDVDGDEVVAAGADFLNLVNDGPTPSQARHDSSKSLVVSLPVKNIVKSASPRFGGNNLDNLTAVVSSLPAYTNASSSSIYPGTDLSMQQSYHYMQSRNKQNVSGFFSSGFAAAEGLPGNSLYGGIIGQLDVPFSNGYENFGDSHLGNQGAIDDSTAWNATNSEYFGGYDPSPFVRPTLLNSTGDSAPNIHTTPTVTQLLTGLMPHAAPQEDNMSGEYYSAGPSTINHTPSSNSMDELNVSWLSHESPSEGRFTGMDSNNVGNVLSSDMAHHHQCHGHEDHVA